MEHQTNIATAKRRTGEEIRQMVAEFAISRMQASEFCLFLANSYLGARVHCNRAAKLRKWPESHFRDAPVKRWEPRSLLR